MFRDFTFPPTLGGMKNPTSNNLILRRGYTPRGAFGELSTPTQNLCTLERPWLSNQTYVSCIPEGIYTLRKRRSGVVERSTGGRYLHGWEVTDVPARTYIMIHPANTMDELAGCIAPGLSTGVLPDKSGQSQWAVLSSLAAFEMLMAELASFEEWRLDVRGYYPEWP